jgi:hypothetical protein
MTTEQQVPEVTAEYRSQEWYREVLQIFADHGATLAAAAAGVTPRTVKRWGQRAGVKSGYDPTLPHTPDDSNAGYRRGIRTEEAVEAHREAVREAKERRVERFKEGETVHACGKASTYSNYDCRGQACRVAWSVYLKKKRGTIDGEPSMAEQVLVDFEGSPLRCPQGLNPLED